MVDTCRTTTAFLKEGVSLPSSPLWIDGVGKGGIKEIIRVFL